MDIRHEKGLLSVIVPVYNVAPYLKKCVDSILAQTYKNIEIILVDDGSTDGSGEMCDAFVNENEKISVYHKENGGQSSARNYGIDVAKGEYIAFVDSDDYIERNIYQVLLHNLVESGKDISACATRYVDFNGNALDRKVYSNSICYIEPEDMLGNMYLSRPPRSEVWNKVFRRAVIADKRFVIEQLFEEIRFDCEVFLNSNGCVYQDTPLHNYLVKRPGNTNSYFNEKKLRVFAELEYAQNCLLQRNATEQAQKIKAYKLSFALMLYEQAVRCCASSGIRSQLMDIIKKEIKENKNNLAARVLWKRVCMFRISPWVYIKLRGFGLFK